MASLVLKDMNEGILDHLRQRAKGHGRTPEEEAKAILAEAMECKDAWAEVDAIYSRLEASGGDFCDSAELLREDRDR